MSFAQAVLDGLHADPAREAIVCGRRRLTGREVLAMVSGAAAALRAGGVRTGDTVACLSGPRPESIVARLASLALGCRHVYLIPGVALGAAADAVRDLDAAALLYEPSRRDEAAALLGAHPVPAGLPLSRERAGLFAASGPVPVAVAAVEPEGVTAVLFTSGTTGGRVPVAHSDRSEAAQLAAALAVYGAEPWRCLVRTVGYLPSLTALWALASGGTAVLLDDGELDAVAGVIERERVREFFAGRPADFYRAAERTGAGGGASSTSGPGSGRHGPRLVVYGGAAAVPRRSARAVRLLGPVVMQCYGLTEAGLVTALSPADHARPELLASVGRPVPGVRLSVRDEEGAELPAGQVGQVWVRSPQLMTGYPSDAARTARTVRDGWLRTGDLGRLDTEGHLFLVDRAEDRLPHGLHAFPIEQTLTDDPTVADAAVFTLPHPDGESLAAVVAAEDGHTPDLDALRARVGATLGHRAAPTRLWLVPEIPRTPGGKPDKVALRDRYREFPAPRAAATSEAT